MGDMMPRDTDSNSGSCSPVHVTRSPSPKSQSKISPFSIASILASSTNHSRSKGSKDDTPESLMSPDNNILAR